MLDYVNKKFWVVLPFHAVRQYAHLKLAPSGVVPQRERRPRPIMDYTFTGVNQASLPLAPDSMQIGHTLQRILQGLVYANTVFGPPHLSKFDLAEGYYRVHLSPEASLELGVVLPSVKGGSAECLVGIPLSLPMGWALSPPYFCAFTETAADLANQSILSRASLPPHHPLTETSQQPSLELPKAQQYSPLAVHPPGPYARHPLSYVDIYIDDFLAIAQQPYLTSTLAHTVNGILSIFRDQPHEADATTRKHIISHSKLLKGDATWSTEKTVLGWLLNTADMTLSLPGHKVARLHQIIQEMLQKNRTSRRQWQRLLGELRHMSTAIRGAKFLFSVLQHVLLDQPGRRICLHHLIKGALTDWAAMAASLQEYPVPMAALVPKAPSYVGAVDASGAGCGGFWVHTTYGNLPQPVAFRYQFPPKIQQALVTHTNPAGTLTNSDLELAAIVAGIAVLQATANTAAASVYVASDNTPTVAWANKGSPSSIGVNAHLLRQLAQLSRFDNCHLQVVSVPGNTNTIADFCSRSFALQDPMFIQELNNHFPVTPPWRLAQIPPDLPSRLTTSLSRAPLPWESVRRGEGPPITLSPYGKPFAKHTTLTPPWHNTKTPSRFSRSSVIDTAMASLLPAKLRSAVERWAMPFEPWARRWPGWDTPIRA